MRRILSTAICSAALAFPAFGQWPPGSAEYSVQTSHYRGISTDPAGGVVLGTQYSAGTRRFSHGSYTVQPYLIVMSNYNVANPRWVIPITGNTNHVYDLTANEWTIYGNTNRTNIISSGYRENYVPLATNAFSWTFGPEWAGAVVTVRATNGQTIGSWGLPAQIGPGGYVLSSSIVTNASLLNGAGVYLDGQSVSSLASAASLAALTNAYRPGYDIEFDGSYQDGDWKIQRSDGSVALSGSVATLNDAINGRFTLTGTNTATFWTRVPGGDGMGGAWVPTPVTFGQNNNVTTYTFIGATNPTTVPVPSPTPTPIPQPSPLTTPATNTTTITTNNLASDEIVEVTVPEANVPSYDVGQTNLVQEAQTVFGRVADGYENFADAFNYTSLTFNEFKKLYLPPPGTECTLSFGPISINLAQFIPGWVRGASKLVFLFAALAAIKRMLWEAFA